MVKIQECGESLVKIEKFCPGLVVAAHVKRDNQDFLRKTVVKKLCKAKQYLPKGMTFVIESAWRSPKVQKDIFEKFLKKAKTKYPSLSYQRAVKEVSKYVAPHKGKYVSGHITGGAVDLRLWKNGKRISMKSSKLSYQENSKSIQPKLPKYLQKNRQIMFNALKKVGLSNHPKEFWHWSYGDSRWARQNKKKTAIYGAVKKVD